MMRTFWTVFFCLSLASVTTLSARGADEVPAATDAAPSTPAKPEAFRLMSASKEAGLRKLLPKLASEKISDLLADDRLLLYTESEMPRCHQDWDGMLPGVHTAYYNISADRSEPYGNGNREFPWGTPAGTHRTSDLYTFRFLHLPTDSEGKTLPVTYYRKHLRGDTTRGYAWLYPIGTVFGEVLCLKTKEGNAVPFELRVRIRKAQEWDVDVFRPFPTAQSLAKRIQELRENWQEQPALAKLVAHLTDEKELPLQRLVDSNHPYRAIDQTMGVDSLPAINDDKLVIELLTTTTFTSAHGEVWRHGKNASFTAAPTTSAKFHVVPAGYDAGFIEVETQSCMRCHETANQHVRNFEPGRDWYGRVRGSDGIFSWHPFDPGSVSYNGYGATPRIRHSFIAAGIVAPFNSQVHTQDKYMRIRGLDE